MIRFHLFVVGCLFIIPHVAFAQMPKSSVVVVEAERRDLPKTMELVGTVQPLKRSLIGSEAAGLVNFMPVRQGDFVKAGDLLVHLDNQILTLQLEEHQATLQALEARLGRWSFEVDWLERLHGDAYANQKEYMDASAERDFAKYSAAEQEVVIRRLRTEIAKSKITAPFDGFVVRLLTEVGEWLGRGGQVVELIDLSSVLVRVNVPESAMPYVEVGATCPVKIDALGAVFQGTVRHIVRQADPQARSFPVEVELANPDHALASGMFARATVISGPDVTTVAVPKDAIVERDGVGYVGIVFPGRDGEMMAVLTPVDRGAESGDWAAVNSVRIQEGSRVVVRGNERLLPFPTAVEIVDASGSPAGEVSSIREDSTGERHN